MLRESPGGLCGMEGTAAHGRFKNFSRTRMELSHGGYSMMRKMRAGGGLRLSARRLGRSLARCLLMTKLFDEEKHTSQMLALAYFYIYQHIDKVFGSTTGGSVALVGIDIGCAKPTP